MIYVHVLEQPIQNNSGKQNKSILILMFVQIAAMWNTKYLQNQKMKLAEVIEAS